MSRLYGDNHRQLQEQFETRRMADVIEKVAMETEVVGPHKDFIESRDMFFLSTVDHKGRPTVSYKAVTRASSRWLMTRQWFFPVMTGTACSCPWGISRAI